MKKRLVNHGAHRLNKTVRYAQHKYKFKQHVKEMSIERDWPIFFVITKFRNESFYKGKYRLKLEFQSIDGITFLG